MRAGALPAVLSCAGAAAARERYLLDDGWLFAGGSGGPGGDVPTPPAPPKSCDFPTNLTGKQCLGLHEHSASSQAACAQACCDDNSCEVWQYCTGGSGCGCWIGQANDCSHDAPQWASMSRAAAPSPPGGSCTDPRCQPGTDDSKWRKIDIPHDFVVEAPFKESASKSAGYLPTGVGWYRKHFTVPASAAGQTVWLDFDGTQAHSQVWLDGELLGGHVSGYTPYRFYLDAAKVAGKEVVLAAQIDATRSDAWWYDGGGIYRSVWLNVAAPVHVKPWGVYVPAEVTGAISGGKADAKLTMSAWVANDGTASAQVSAAFTVLDAAGHSAATASAKVTVPAGAAGYANVSSVALKSASLWSVDTPTLYTLRTAISVGGKVVDTVDTTFGVRKAVFDAQKGFILNDVPTKILGACNHQDFAGVGVAVPDSLQMYRVAKLKEMGANGWRTAHNMPAEGLLDAADKLGFVVWDENHHSTEPDEAAILVMRDRNHPSVVIWSVCNEKLCNGADGSAVKGTFKHLDPGMNRPTSANQNGWLGADSVLDLLGFDYGTGNYDKWLAAAPNKPAISSETSSAVSDRGEYANDKTKGYVRGYDTEHPGWAQTAEVAWDGIESHDRVSGGWTWTGFDYKGEPTPDGWPNINSHFGIIDIAGFPKDRFYWYQQNYVRPDPPLVHLFPHWNWATEAHGSGSHLAECKGHCKELGAGAGASVEVWVFSNADEVELLVNGVSSGRKAAGPTSHAAWTGVAYAPGHIEARAYKKNGTTALTTTRVSTTGAAAAVRASIKDGVGASGIEADNSDVALVQVEVVDKDGNVVPTAAHNVTFAVSGPGKLIGTGNGDPSCHVNDKSASRPVYHGLALAVIQGTLDAGNIVVTATAQGLSGSSKVSIKSSKPGSPKKRL